MPALCIGNLYQKVQFDQRVGFVWDPSGHTTMLSLLSNEELLAVALTLGGASAADVLANSSGRFQVAKLTAGGLTLLATLGAVALYLHLREV